MAEIRWRPLVSRCDDSERCWDGDKAHPASLRQLSGAWTFKKLGHLTRDASNKRQGSTQGKATAQDHPIEQSKLYFQMSDIDVELI